MNSMRQYLCMGNEFHEKVYRKEIKNNEKRFCYTLNNDQISFSVKTLSPAYNYVSTISMAGTPPIIANKGLANEINTGIFQRSVNGSASPRGRSIVIPFLNKNVALRSETHRAISFSAFCAFRGKSRGKDAPPTMTLQILMGDLLSELV